MYPSEYDEFVKELTDLCIAVNRPCGNDLVRVFWDDLKDVPFAAVARQAALVRKHGKTKFTSNDLRPPPEERMQFTGPDNVSIMLRLSEHVMRHCSLSHYQRIKPKTYIFAGPRELPRCVGIKVDADGENWPGVVVRVEDCDIDLPMTSQRRDAPPARNQSWNEADAARDLLNRGKV